MTNTMVTHVRVASPQYHARWPEHSWGCRGAGERVVFAFRQNMAS